MPGPTLNLSTNKNTKHWKTFCSALVLDHENIGSADPKGSLPDAAIVHQKVLPLQNDYRSKRHLYKMTASNLALWKHTWNGLHYKMDLVWLGSKQDPTIKCPPRQMMSSCSCHKLSLLNDGGWWHLFTKHLNHYNMQAHEVIMGHDFYIKNIVI